MPRLLTTHITLGLLITLIFLRCVAQALVPLMHQEAYYWMYAQHPSLSYFDHPPMVAWVIMAGTAVFGDHEWGVRAVGSLLMLANGGLMYAFARLWWGRSVATASALFLELAPVYFGIGLLATMDSSLLFFWLLGLLGFSAAVRRGRVAGWYLCGFGLGGALLSKYTGIMLVPGVGLLLLFHRPWRRWLRTIHPYIAVLLGIAMFSPVLVWNARHHWASFRFQFLSRFDVAASSHKHTFLEFLGMQVGVATPVILAGAVIILYRVTRRRRASSREKLAFAFAVPLWLSIAHKGWTYPTHIDWTAPAYLALIPAAFQIARVRIRARRTHPAWLWRGGAAGFTLIVCAIVNLSLLLLLLFVQPGRHLFPLFGPWDQLAATVDHYEDALQLKTGREPLVIVCGKYELASLMAFYRHDANPNEHAAVTTINQMPLGGTSLGFAYWADQSSWKGKDCILLDEGLNPLSRLNGQFSSAKVVWSGKASNGKHYSIAECLNYREPPKIASN